MDMHIDMEIDEMVKEMARRESAKAFTKEIGLANKDGKLHTTLFGRKTPTDQFSDDLETQLVKMQEAGYKIVSVSPVSHLDKMLALILYR